MNDDDLVRRDGEHWLVKIPLTGDGRERLRALRARTNFSNNSRLFLQGIQRYRWYLKVTAAKYNVCAKLGNFLERYDELPRRNDHIFAIKSELTVRVVFILRLHANDLAVIKKIAAEQEMQVIEFLRESFLLYEWYVHKCMTGHEIVLCKFHYDETKFVL